MIRKGRSRGSFQNTLRFDCICHKCNKKFKSQFLESKECYDCYRIIVIQVENQTIGIFKEKEMNCSATESICNDSKNIL